MPRREVTVGDRVFTVYDDGAPDGRAILFHHGTPAAGGPLAPWVQDAHARGARLIGYDRPGYSGSTPDPGRTVGDAARDSAAILDALGIERFVTWGISGGGPHALACAALLPNPVDAVGLLGSVAPFDADGLNYFRGMGADNLVEFGLAMGGRAHLASFLEREAGHMRTAAPEEPGRGDPGRRGVARAGRSPPHAARTSDSRRAGVAAGPLTGYQVPPTGHPPCPAVVHE